MTYFFVALIVVLAIMVVVSLVRGLVAFLQMTEEDLKSDGVGKSHEMQNKMMFNRVKYQALAIVAVVVMLLVTGGGQ